MLNQKEKDEIREVESQKLTPNEARKVADKEAGIDGAVARLNQLIETASKLAEEIEPLTSEKFEVFFKRNRTFNPSIERDCKWHDVYTEATKGNQTQINAIKRKYADKRNHLWLCETLEEAKEIVGI